MVEVDFFLSTILDDYSRYIIARKLCTTMKAKDITDTLELALEVSGCDSATVVQKPRLLSDNGSSYVAADLADYLEDKGMDHVRGAPHHPQTQGKVERWHQTMKNRVLWENYLLPGDLEHQIGAFVDHYNNHRYHESLTNLTPGDVYHGRGEQILKKREESKSRQSDYASCSTKLLLPKLKQRPNQNLFYKMALTNVNHTNAEGFQDAPDVSLRALAQTDQTLARANQAAEPIGFLYTDMDRGKPVGARELRQAFGSIGLVEPRRQALVCFAGIDACGRKTKSRHPTLQPD